MQPTVVSGKIDNPTQSYGDGAEAGFLQGKAAEIINASLHGQYYTQTYRGNVFHGSTLIAGTAIPVITTTAPTCILWNPSGSGVNVVPIAFRAGFASGTGIAGQIAYAQLPDAGTGPLNAVITAFTAIAPSNGKIGAGGGVAKFATTATIVTTSVSILRASGISQGAPITSTAAVWNMTDLFNGEVILPPGTAIYPVASAAIAEVLCQSFSWVEVPV